MNTSSRVLNCHTIIIFFGSVNLITAQLSVQPLLVWLKKCNINEKRALIILNCLCSNVQLLHRLQNSCNLLELLVNVLQRETKSSNKENQIYTNKTEFTATKADLELWNGHLKWPVANLSRGFNKLQQQGHVGRVERPTRVRAHRHSKFPLDIHNLQIEITNLAVIFFT